MHGCGENAKEAARKQFKESHTVKPTDVDKEKLRLKLDEKLKKMKKNRSTAKR